MTAAGASAIPAENRKWKSVPADRALTRLAPAMVAAIEAAEAACRAARLPVLRFETFRSRARQEWLYAQGRAVTPPNKVVTNASSAVRSWHAYGLAVDFIHPRLHWDAGRPWWEDIAALITPHGLAWGGDWVTLPDVPHFQWAGCPIAPRAVDRADYERGQLDAVWRRYAATEPQPMQRAA